MLKAKLERLFAESEELQNRKIVCIGGGTGLSSVLKGIKHYTDNVTAIVTVADNGGSSGKLRREMNMLPPGDIRNCVLALAEIEPLMEKVFQYRFREGSLSGQNLGNLFIAALTQICGSFELAIEKMSDILAVKGRVLPVTTAHVQLQGTYQDNSKVLGEEEIVFKNKIMRQRIKAVELVPANPPAYDKAVQAIEEADVLLFGPGSLYTSIIPNLLVKGIKEAIVASASRKFYIANLMTQPGETDNYRLSDHIQAIEDYLGKGLIQQIVISSQVIPASTLAFYKEDSAIPVANDLSPADGYQVIEGDFAKVSSVDHYLRHDSEKLAACILEQAFG